MSGVNAAGSGVLAFAMPPTPPGPLAVFAVRRTTPGAPWIGPERVSTGSTDAVAPRAAMTDSGTAVLVWQQVESGQSRVKLAEFASGGLAWTTPIDVSPAGANATDPRVVVCGDTATVVWLAGGVVHSRRRIGTNAFGPVVPIDVVGAAVAPVDVGASASCEVTAVWRRQAASAFLVASVARADTGAWGAATALSAQGEDPFSPALTVAEDARTAVAWRTRHGAVDVVRAAVRAADVWRQAATVATTSGRVSGIALATDRFGVVTAAWGVRSLDNQPGVIAFSRLPAAASAWSAPAVAQVMANSTNIPGALAAAADRTGTVTVAYAYGMNADLPVLDTIRFDPLSGRWHRAGAFGGDGPVLDLMPGDRLRLSWLEYPQAGGPAFAVTTDYDTTPLAPAIARTSPADGVAAVTVTPPPSESGFEPVTYEYSLDGGTTWTPRVPASPATTFTIAGLTNGTTYSLAVRAVNRAGTGPASAVVPVVPIAVPLAPSDFHVAARTGGAITLAWRDDGVTPNDSFVIEGGVAPGQTLASLAVGASSRTLTLTVGPGRYYVRVHAVRGGVRSAASNELVFTQGLPVAPSAPRHLLGLTAGNTLALSWTPGLDGGPVDAYALDVVGTLAGSVNLGPGDTFSAAGVPSGFYRATVRALNAAGSSAASNPVDVFIPGSCAAPSPPEYLRATATGRTLRVEWAPPSGGAAVSRYDLIVQGSVVGTFPVATREIAAVVSGSFTFRVVAVNACGASAATSPVSIVVP